MIKVMVTEYKFLYKHPEITEKVICETVENFKCGTNLIGMGIDEADIFKNIGDRIVSKTQYGLLSKFLRDVISVS